MARRIEDSLKCCPWLDLAISALKANELEGVKFKNINCQWCVETDISIWTYVFHLLWQQKTGKWLSQYICYILQLVVIFITMLVDILRISVSYLKILDCFVRIMHCNLRSGPTYISSYVLPLFFSPCPPEFYLQSETKIEPDLRLNALFNRWFGNLCYY